MQTTSLATFVETFKRMVSGQDYIRYFFYFLVLVSILAAANNKQRKRKQEERNILENGLTIEKAFFYEERASAFGGKAILTILLGMVVLLVFVADNKTFPFCLKAVCAFITLAFIAKTVIWHNKAVPFFQEMRRETAASLGPDSRLDDYVLQFMECTKYKDPYMNFGRDVNVKANEAITVMEKELFTEILLEARRENDVTKSFLADMKMRLTEKKKSAGNACKMAIDGLQERIEYLMRYDKITLKSSVRALIHIMKFDEDE